VWPAFLEMIFHRFIHDELIKSALYTMISSYYFEAPVTVCNEGYRSFCYGAAS